MNITITIGETVLAATLENNEASREFAAMFPIKLELTDYASTEKVSDLPKKLSTAGAPAGYKASAGDITYYAPWGNLAIFYKDFSYAGGLVKLGHIDGDLNALAKQNNAFWVVFKRAESK